MIPKKYQRKNAKWWSGQRVITAVELSTYCGTIGAGVVCEVYHKYSGLAIKTERCRKCGVQLKVRKVSYDELILLDDVVEVERDKAIVRAEEECVIKDMAILDWNGRYLIVPDKVAVASPYEIVYACGYTGGTPSTHWASFPTKGVM